MKKYIPTNYTGKVLDDNIFVIQSPKVVEGRVTTHNPELHLSDSYAYRVYFHALDQMINTIQNYDVSTAIIKATTIRLFGMDAGGLGGGFELVMDKDPNDVWDSVASGICYSCDDLNTGEWSGMNDDDYYALQILACFTQDEVGVMAITAANAVFNTFTELYKEGEVIGVEAINEIMEDKIGDWGNWLCGEVNGKIKLDFSGFLKENLEETTEYPVRELDK
ncbi:hypothetical protein GCM10009128_06040 [Psychrosphaera haliotis]|uniref:hypothetical protein n=1 Tax=Psychrosphaera haliotis TaxID=555083 RepID=UPI0031E0B581